MVYDNYVNYDLGYLYSFFNNHAVHPQIVHTDHACCGLLLVALLIYLGVIIGKETARVSWGHILTAFRGVSFVKRIQWKFGME